MDYELRTQDSGLSIMEGYLLSRDLTAIKIYGARSENDGVWTMVSRRDKSYYLSLFEEVFPMGRKSTRYFIALAACAILAGCSKQGEKATGLKYFPVDSAEGVINRSNVSLNERHTTDGNGSLMVFTVRPTVVRLYEVHDIDVENARLLYQARVSTEGVEGQVYLEMWCHFPGIG